jgi:hypothetical protein
MPKLTLLNLSIASVITLACISTTTASTSSAQSVLPTQGASTSVAQVNPSNIPPYLATLIHTNRLEDAFIGVAAKPSLIHQAFEQTLSQRYFLFPQLQAAYPTATPAGKLYLAQVIQAVSPETGKRLLQQLANDSTPITRLSGCMVEPTTVSVVAKQLLAQQPRP